MKNYTQNISLDYHPFGSVIPGRNFTSSNGYRYGFNGMEKDGNDWTGNDGSHLDFGARIYDSRLGRWLAPDPLENEYSFVSPYVFSLNTPIQAKDPDGERVFFVILTSMTYESSALLRVKEIKNMDNYNDVHDHVYYIVMDNNSNLLKTEIENSVSDACSNGYGKTVELSTFGHGGNDGPVMKKANTGDFDLYDLTKWPKSQGQLSPDGWADINFNFDKNNSLAVFYGCKTAKFAMTFVSFTNVKYASGMMEGAGPSSSNEEFSNSFFSFKKDSWLWDGNLMPIYKKDGINIMEYPTGNLEIGRTGEGNFNLVMSRSTVIGSSNPNVTLEKAKSFDRLDSRPKGVSGPTLPNGTF